LERQAAQELERRRDQAFADRLLVTEQRVQLMERDVQRARKDAAMSVQVMSPSSISSFNVVLNASLPSGISQSNAGKSHAQGMGPE
jgi:hypothetical protein